MDIQFYFMFTLGYISLFIWGLSGLNSSRFLTWSSFIFAILGALIFDNAVLGFGKWIGEGTVLESLNALRYWSHAFFTPLLVLFSLGVLRESGIAWTDKKWLTLSAIIYTIGLIGIEIWLETSRLQLKPKTEFGVLRYVSTESASGPPIMILLVTIVLLVAGIVLWKQTKWPWFFIGAAVMTIGSMVPLNINSAAVTNAFELFLLWALVWTKHRLTLYPI
ncbi:hypothetical protein [Paenisporosarcina indica]|uniref:hypothetical protein n=1 Tax=Paenisporosarcina indica TaxID=650093 RepID=UPI0009501B5E|nr:hypothetical protein [Paenisporosarcina indica]